MVDLVDGVTSLCAGSEVEIALYGEGVALAGLIVKLHVTRLAFGGERIGLRLQGLCVLGVTSTLPQQFGTLGLKERGVKR